MAAEKYSDWSKLELYFFRFSFIALLLLCIPLDWKYWADIFNITWSDLHYTDLFRIVRYYPSFLENDILNWLLIASVAVVGTILWTLKSPDVKQYNELKYWLRLMVRIRLSAAVIGYAFLKIFLLQSPAPSLSMLNSLYGDLHAWKTFSISLGAAPLYELFLGYVELFCGLLLLFRRTTVFGATLLLAFTGNIFLSNIAYEGGETFYAFYLVVLSLYLLSHDAIRIFYLLSLEKPTLPDLYKPVFKGSKRYVSPALKLVFVGLFIVPYFFKVQAGTSLNQHNVPSEKGLDNVEGFYDVELFVVNGDTLPYSKTDDIRWQDVVFEKWNTFSVRSRKLVNLYLLGEEHAVKNDAEKLYELEGVAGRHFYRYSFDESSKTISTQNKNPHHTDDRYQFTFSRPDSETITLNGKDAGNNTYTIILKRINKKYLLLEGRRKPQTL